MKATGDELRTKSGILAGLVPAERLAESLKGLLSAERIVVDGGPAPVWVRRPGAVAAS